MKKIVIIGPESTGKSTLCESLAAHYKTSWVKEYAREYLTANGKEYTYEQLLDIAKGQVSAEDTAIAAYKNNPGPLFIDTNMQVMKVWCEFVFEKCQHWILNRIVEREYDGYLLCDTDLPWEKDELREYPDQASRNRLFLHYKDILVNQDLPWAIIRGNHQQRFENAVKAVDSIIAVNSK